VGGGGGGACLDAATSPRWQPVEANSTMPPRHSAQRVGC